MKRIGLISDSHGFLDPRLLEIFSDVDEIWHAGDIGSSNVLEQLRNFKPVRCVYGNIDDQHIRHSCDDVLRFECEGMDVVMTHIGGYPGKYSPKVAAIMKQHPPQLQISGHSHILKVMFDNKYQCMHLNPGACGKFGMHTVRTALRFTIDNGALADMEVIELGHRVG